MSQPPNLQAFARAIAAASAQSAKAAGAAVGAASFRAMVGSAGSAINVPPPASAYGDWIAGRGTEHYLPRPRDVFASGAFGPMTPMEPMPIDVPGPDGRAEPRRNQYPVGWNMPIGIPGSEGLKLASFQQIRYMADLYSVARACIETRKNELIGIDWDIVMTEEAGKAAGDDAATHKEFAERRAKVVRFFGAPDPNYHNYASWFSAVLEEVFVTDSLSLYVHPTRMRGKGLLGSDVAALDLIDGTTIRPLVDIRGGRPRSPSPAYQQYLWGVPRVELTDMWDDSDIDDAGPPAMEYRTDQLLYLPYTRRTWTPYGFPGTERSLLPVLIGLKRQQSFLDYFTEGSIPGAYIIPGPDMIQPTQIAQLQNTLNAIAGDQAQKNRVIVLPGGSKVQEIKPKTLADLFDAVIVEHVLMNFEVMPIELGLAPGGQKNGLGGKGLGDASENVTARKSTVPLLKWLKRAIFDYTVQIVCGQTDMEWKWLGFDIAEDEEKRVNNSVKQIERGVASIDEIRSEFGRKPWGLPLSTQPIIMTAAGPVTLELPDPPAPAPQFGGGGFGNADTPDNGAPEDDPGPDDGGGGGGKPPSGDGSGTDTAAHDAAEADQEAENGAAEETGKAARSSALFKVADGTRPTGVIVALVPPAAVARKLVLPGAEPAAELHVTLAYLGAVVDLDARAMARITAAVQAVALNSDALSGVISGVGRFSGTEEDGDPIYASVDVPTLPALRERLVSALSAAGYPAEISHGFTPHITLAYVPAEAPSPLERLTPVPVAFGELWVWSGPERLSYPLRAGAAKAVRAEVRKLRNYLRNGGDPARFVTDLLPPGLAEKTGRRAAHKGIGRAIGLAVADLQRSRASDKDREKKIGPLLTSVSDQLGSAASAVLSGAMTPAAFVASAVADLDEAYLRAYTYGAEYENSDYDLDSDDEGVIAEQVARQKKYLEGFAEALAEGMSPEAASARAALYAGSVRGLYERGRQAIAEDREGARAIWHAEMDADTCDPCAELDGEEFTAEDLPGYPGDPGICDGGGACRCELEWIDELGDPLEED